MPEDWGQKEFKARPTLNGVNVITGAGTVLQVPIFNTGGATIFGSPQLTWDDSTKRLTIVGGIVNGTTRQTAGSSFPTAPTPQIGDMHWHTTRLRWYGYDGMRWLGDPYPFGMYAYTTGAQPYAANAAILQGGLPSAFDLYVKEWRPAFYVNTTNNASNYWTFTLTADGGSFPTLASFNTSTYSPNTYSLLAVAITSFGINPVLRSTQFNINISIAKTGAPGSVEFYGPALTVQEIG